jgi:hypothetical protein
MTNRDHIERLEPRLLFSSSSLHGAHTRLTLLSHTAVTRQQHRHQRRSQAQAVNATAATTAAPTCVTYEVGDFGTVLPLGMDASELTGDLTIKYQSLNGGNFQKDDITVVG